MIRQQMDASVVGQQLNPNQTPPEWAKAVAAEAETRQRDPGDVASPMSPAINGASGLAGAAQWSDHRLLREMEALSDQFASGTPVNILTRAAWKRLGVLMGEVQQHRQESRRAGALQHQAEDRLRLVRLAVGHD